VSVNAKQETVASAEAKRILRITCNMKHNWCLQFKHFSLKVFLQNKYLMHITFDYSGKNIVFEFCYSTKKHFLQVQVPTLYVPSRQR